MPSRIRKVSSSRPQWAVAVWELRKRLQLDQTALGQQVHSSAMGVSRWERGTQEPPSHSYIELGNLAGDPDCWYFWGRAGLRSEDVMRVLPKLRGRSPDMQDFEVVHAGTSAKKPNKKTQLVAIPLLKLV